MLADGIDYNFVVAIRELLTGYKETHNIPTGICFISKDKLKKELKDFPDLIDLIPDNEKLNQNTLDIILKEYISRTTN